MTSILGISAFYHDSAAALIVDGDIVAAAQEERFSRKKHDPRYPFNAVKYVLKESNLELNKVDHIVFFEKPFLKFERLLETYMAFAPKGFKSFSMSMPLWLREKLLQKKLRYTRKQRRIGNRNSHDVSDQKGWPEIFGTTDKEEIKRRCEIEGERVHWDNNDNFISTVSLLSIHTNNFFIIHSM